MSGKRNTSGLVTYAQKKAQETRQRVSADAIDWMLDQKAEGELRHYGQDSI